MAPYRCPICDGRGIVPGGFYNSTNVCSVSYRSTEPCRACNGTGVLWELVTYQPMGVTEDAETD
jgi:DnaJ-class molecular chaperone